jgi:hypothetical protein
MWRVRGGKHPYGGADLTEAAALRSFFRPVATRVGGEQYA